MSDIECSLDRDLLLESEKGTYYWSFDTKELTRGNIKERYEAYKIGLEKNFLQIDEIREKKTWNRSDSSGLHLGLTAFSLTRKPGRFIHRTPMLYRIWTSFKRDS